MPFLQIWEYLEKLEAILTRHDFLKSVQVILSNDQTDFNWYKFTFCQVLK